MRFLRSQLLFLCLIFCTLLLQSCSGGLSSQASYYLQFADETPICNLDYSYPTGSILTGTAKFEKRGTKLITELTTVSNQATVKLKNMVLSDPLPEALPIQNAEIAVYDENLKLVQCGQTDSDGSFKATDSTSDLYLPNIPQNYLVRVLARSNYLFSSSDDYLNVSVKKDTYHNEVHFIQQSVYSDGVNGASVDMVALARQNPENLEVTGGAFNILNNIQQAYDYIKLTTTSGTTNCLSTKLNVYWKAGFNPMQYLNPDADPETLSNTSYFLQSTNELFISGGQVGDVSLSNTDHFDDFATIHELGHFVEKNCGQFTSAGGSHAIVVRIDPRLAWSEGWSNYFATQVMNSQMPNLDPTMSDKLIEANENNGWTFFFNSAGFIDSTQNISNGIGFMIDFKNAGTNPGEYSSGAYSGSSFDKVNPTLYKGEGHTREGAISRGLFKLVNDCGQYCISTGDKIPFGDIWKSFDQITGIAQVSTTTPFLSSHTFLTQLKTIHTSWNSNHDTILSNEALHISESTDFTSGGRVLWSGYGKRLIPGSCSLSIEPRTDDPSLTGSNSDQRYSNQNFTVDQYLLPAGTSSISVQFTKASGTDTDHDLLLFKPFYSFNDDYRCTAEDSSGNCTGTWVAQRATTSDVIRSDRKTATTLSSTYTKSISSINTLDYTYQYLLNIRSYTANKSIGSSTLYNYTITAQPGGQQLCPEP